MFTLECVSCLLSSVFVYSRVFFCCLCRLVEDVDLQVATYTEFGKDIPKLSKMSPDGFLQNAILLTYFK